MEKSVEQEQAQDQVELTSDEINAEQASELPDREAMSLISAGGLTSIAPVTGDLQPQPLDPGGYNAIDPVEPTTL